MMSATDVKPRTEGRYSGCCGDGGGGGGGEEPDEPSSSQLILTDPVSASGEMQKIALVEHDGPPLRPIVIFRAIQGLPNYKSRSQVISEYKFPPKL